VVGELPLSSRWAWSVLGDHHQAVVSLSRRWTIPGRLTPPTPERLSPQWAMSALTSVPVQLPAAGWTTSPSAVDDDELVVLEHHLERDILRVTSSSSGGGRSSKIVPPA